MFVLTTIITNARQSVEMCNWVNEHICVGNRMKMVVINARSGDTVHWTFPNEEDLVQFKLAML